MVKIVHMADIHFASPLTSLPDMKKRSIRREEIKRTFERVIKNAAEEGTDLVLISGDLFNNRFISQKTITEVIDILNRAKGLRFFISPGNHDHAHPKSVYRTCEFPENTTVFLHQKIESVFLPDLNTRVYGAAFCSPEIRESLLEGFRVSSESEINLMVLHGDVGNPASVYNPISEAMIEKSGLDYLALGHVHAHGGIHRAGKTFYAYSGCLEPRGFDETGTKGYIEGYLSCGNCSLAFAEASERKYVTQRIDIGGCETIFDIIRRVEQKKTDPEGICLFLLTGELPDLDIVDEKLLYEHFAGKLFDFKFKNEARLLIDLKKMANERSLKGIFVKNMEMARREAKDKTEEEKAVLALRYGLDALTGNEFLLHDR